MTFSELVVLARVAKALKAKTIFEVGSYNGLTTAVFLLNSEPEARVLTLDLPPSAGREQALITSDQNLVANRHLSSVPEALGLYKYTQLLCDSLVFDPSPYLDSVDLGLIDGAHDLAHVQNDTLKMARMISSSGIVFWHDYGGKGALRPLTSYLDALAKRRPLYRISRTSLAWAHGRDLKEAIGRVSRVWPVKEKVA
jgi:hypothetical protein